MNYFLFASFNINRIKHLAISKDLAVISFDSRLQNHRNKTFAIANVATECRPRPRIKLKQMQI